MKRLATLVLAMVATMFIGIMSSFAEDDMQKLVLQISDNDPQKMNTVLNVAANVTRHYQDQGEEIDVKIVAFNAGLHMMRPDTSPVAERMTSFSQSMPNVEFHACKNTMTGMSKKEGKQIEVMEFAKVVPAGVVDIMELDRQGYTVIRP